MGEKVLTVEQVEALCAGEAHVSWNDAGVPTTWWVEVVLQRLKGHDAALRASLAAAEKSLENERRACDDANRVVKYNWHLLQEANEKLANTQRVAEEEIRELRSERDDRDRLLSAANKDRKRIVGIFQEAIGALVAHGLDVQKILGRELEEQVHGIVELEQPAKGETRDELRASLADAKSENRRCREDCRVLCEKRDALEDELRQTQGERDSLSADVERLTRENEEVDGGCTDCGNKHMDWISRLEKMVEVAKSERDAALSSATAAEERASEAEAKSKIDEAQCDEVTDQAGRLAERVTDAESRAEKAESDARALRGVLGEVIGKWTHGPAYPGLFNRATALSAGPVDDPVKEAVEVLRAVLCSRQPWLGSASEAPMVKELLSDELRDHANAVIARKP